MLIKANLRNANISDSHIYGISTWEIDLENAIQKNLVITPHKETTITVDNMEVAQFLHLLLGRVFKISF